MTCKFKSCNCIKNIPDSKYTKICENAQVVRCKINNKFEYYIIGSNKRHWFDSRIFKLEFNHDEIKFIHVGRYSGAEFKSFFRVLLSHYIWHIVILKLFTVVLTLLMFTSSHFESFQNIWWEFNINVSQSSVRPEQYPTLLKISI